MNKPLVLIAIFCTLTMALYSQNPDEASVLTANSEITEIRLNGFEDASFWDVGMPIDQGIITKRSRIGHPQDLINEKGKARDEKYAIPDTYSKEGVLGIKVEYISRGYNWFSIKPVKPVVIEGITQSISFWVAGRSYRHWMKILIKDFEDKDMIIPVDRLNFQGWKELVVSIPERVKQRDYHFVDKRGIKFNGFLIECDPVETYGSYYIYFDELRAVTDLFNEKTRDQNDMPDDW